MTDRLFDIRDRVVMVAGGAGGLGGVLARAFAERGARIALADIDGTQARKFAETLGAADGNGLGCTLDVRMTFVCAHPGHSQDRSRRRRQGGGVTVTPNGAHSRASTRANCDTPALAAA